MRHVSSLFSKQTAGSPAPQSTTTPSARRLAVACSLVLALLLGACTLGTATTGGATGSPTASSAASTATTAPSATTTPSAQVIGAFGNAVAVAGNTTGTASVSCPNGEPMLSGGFIVRLDNVNTEDGIPLSDSYPSGSSTWTVTVATQAGSVHLTPVAACLKANFAVTTQIVHSNISNNADTAVSCPVGTTLTGGGFQSGGGINVASQPNGNGWKISTGGPFGVTITPTVYALCATGLHAGSVQSATKTVANNSVTANGAGCPAGQYPVGGGYNGYVPGSDTFWDVFLNTPETGQGTISSGWMTEVHSGMPGTAAFTVYSVCDTH